MTGNRPRHPHQRSLDAAYYRRKRDGAVVISIEIERDQLRALESAGLLAIGNRDKPAIAWALRQYLRGLPDFVHWAERVFPPEVWTRFEAERGTGTDAA